jgi:hypothetical protein
LRFRHLFFVALAAFHLPAQAVPSFARQMGVPCQTCHTAFPELTAFGRWFKLHGYTASNPQRSGIDRLPVAAMAQVSLTRTRDASGASGGSLPDNDAVVLQQLSGFLAGRLGDHAGAFVQVTYDGVEHHASLDLADIRAVWNPNAAGHDLLLGFSANNSPTVQDPWNSLSVWGFPYARSSVAASPAAAVILDSGVQVAGLTAYAMLDGHWYGGLGLYRRGTPGIARIATLGNPVETDVQGAAPYVRLVWQQDQGPASYSLGAVAFAANLYPHAGQRSGATDRFTDVGVDGQMQYALPDATLSSHVAYVHEGQRREGSIASGLASRSRGRLDSLHADISYVLRHRYVASLGFQQLRGTADPLLLPSGDFVAGSAIGSPDSQAFIVEFDYLPIPQLKLGAQWTAYTRFQGASRNYDGFGRSAAANDSLYLMAWFAL